MKNTDTDTIYQVSQLNREANLLLTQQFSAVWVTGEISNLSRPSSGHIYFSLKDHQAQIRCALFRFKHTQINFSLENGQEVIVHAQVSLYEPRGDFQLIVSHVQLAGAGKLQIAFEQLKTMLGKQGLFDEAHKKPLPFFPKRIGVITSPTAAALQDILNVLKKRCPLIPILVYPTMVQGESAATQIVAMIQKANQHNTCDVIIVARGGGSIEDLWSFNEAIVAHAIFDSVIPIVTGIGHQTDFTISDFVADYRAPTPSAAAEVVSPDHITFLDKLSDQYHRLMQCMQSQLKSHQVYLSHLQKRLQHPTEKLTQYAQQLDQLENRLRMSMQFYLEKKIQKIAHLSQLLDTLSPLQILKRGYSITRLKTSGIIIKKQQDVSVGDSLLTRLIDGEIESIVSRID